MSDINVVEPSQSFTGNLAPNASFLGPYIPLQDFTSVTTIAKAAVPPAAANAIQFEWSSDGVNTDSVTPFGSDASTEQTAMSTVKAAFFRVRYTAGPGGLTGARVQTLLRTGPFNSSVSRVGLLTGSPDALNTNAVLLGKATTTYQAIKAYPDVVTATDFMLGVVPPPARSNGGPTIITNASLTAVNLDPNVSPATRRWAVVTNNTTRGILYIRNVNTPTLVTYDFKIPPQHHWTLPESWVGVSGRWLGIWDIADGSCSWMEAT